MKTVCLAGLLRVKTILLAITPSLQKTPMHIQKIWRTNKTITFQLLPLLLSCQILQEHKFCINDRLMIERSLSYRLLKNLWPFQKIIWRFLRLIITIFIMKHYIMKAFMFFQRIIFWMSDTIQLFLTKSILNKNLQMFPTLILIAYLNLKNLLLWSIEYRIPDLPASFDNFVPNIGRIWWSLCNPGHLLLLPWVLQYLVLNKAKWFLFYGRERRRYKTILLQRKNATHGYTRP